MLSLCGRVALVSSFVVLGAVVPASADIDLTGSWFSPSSFGERVEIVQTGSDVTLTFHTSNADVVYTGTFDQTTVEAAASDREIDLTVSIDGGFLEGTITIPGPTFTQHVPTHLWRCDCDDGNAVNGDGCDAECRVEECYTCTGVPSDCVPSADAAACDDRSDCTTGETCSAGTCGGGTAVPSCIDVSGLWRFSGTDYYDFFTVLIGSKSFDARIVQRDGVLLVYDETSDAGDGPTAVGSVDPVSGEMDFRITLSSGPGICGSSYEGFEGTAANDGSTATGYVTMPGVGGVMNPCPFTRLDGTGTQCDPDLGCDLTDCTGHPDGTPCADDKDYTNRETCQSGLCVAKAACPLCNSWTEEGRCEFRRPQATCRASTSDRSSQLALTSSGGPGRDKVKFQWKKGEATSLAEFGDPQLTNEMALCIFGPDDSSSTPYLLATDESCETPPCWREKTDQLLFKGSGLQISLKAGEDESAAVSTSMRGDLMNALVIEVPVVAQLQIDNGACFEAVFGSDDVRRFDAEHFKAKGGHE